MNFKSTYNIRRDWSYKGENFISIPLTWRLGVCSIDILKIRIAHWKPKYNRSNQAIYYYDVTSKQEADVILDSFKEFDFKAVEDYFEAKYLVDKPGHTTGIVDKWLNEVLIPDIRAKFII